MPLIKETKPNQTSVLVSPFTPSFLDMYSVPMSSPWCKALYLVINFFGLFVCIPLEHFKNGQGYFYKRDTAHEVITLIRFLQHSLVFRSILVILRYYFLILHFISVCLRVSASFKRSDGFLIRQLDTLRCFSSPLFDISIAIFQCQIPFLYPGCIFLSFLSRSPVFIQFLQIAG